MRFQSLTIFKPGDFVMRFQSLLLPLILSITCTAGFSAESAVALAPAPAAIVVNSGISEAEVISAQKAWGEALVAISTTFEKDGLPAAKALAGAVIDAAYGYQYGVVLFKPTLAEAPQTFRTTRAGALAYFVGDDVAFPHDKGFALKGWRKVEVRNAGIYLSGDTATSMGNVQLTDKDGKVTIVDKTWTWRKDDSGRLRIMVHHSSLPYTPAK